MPQIKFAKKSIKWAVPFPVVSFPVELFSIEETKLLVELKRDDSSITVLHNGKKVVHLQKLYCYNQIINKII